VEGDFQVQSRIQCWIQDEIRDACKHSIILNQEYLDDEQLTRARQFAVLTEIFNAKVRDAEVRTICNHFAPIFQDGHPTHLSVLGKTGTGKTITILYLLNELERLARKDGIGFLQLHLDLCCPAPCFRALNNLACLLGATKQYKRGISLEELMNRIETTLATRTGYVVIFVDEADNVRTDFNTFYQFLIKRLPQRIQAKLILIFVSNRLTWSDNLDPRVKSALKMREIMFEPYDAEDLQTILQIRVEKCFRKNMIGEGFVEKIAAFASRKHGDARRAIDLLTRSAYIAERLRKPITLDVVDQANEEIERDKYVEMMRRSPKHLQAALYASLLGKSKGKALHTGDAYLVYDKFCQSVALRPLTQRAFTDLLGELDMYGYIRARTVSRGRYGRTKEIYVSLAPNIIDKLIEVIHLNFDITSGVVS